MNFNFFNFGQQTQKGDNQLQQNFQSYGCQKIVNNIIQYSQSNGRLLTKYSQQFYLEYFDKAVINQAIKKFNINNRKQMTIQQFIRSFLNIIHHSNHQTLYLAMSLKNLYSKIKQNVKNQTGVKFSDFTNYLCQQITSNDFNTVVPVKQVPKQKFIPVVDKVRQIDINPAIVIKNGQTDLPKIAKEKRKKDKRPVERKAIAQLIYNFQKQQIITVGRLSSSIYFYDLQLNKTRQIIPKTYKDMAHEIAILSIAFNDSYERIGAIINGIGIAFWQAVDKFQTQKTISKYYGDKIYFLNLFKQWVTTDKNTIYFWDIKDQSVTNKIVYEESIFINDICQINHLRCICVSYTAKDDKKVFIVYKNMKQIIKYDLGSAGCHTLLYNMASQTMISAGYHNQLQVFQIQNNTFSVNLKKQLRGHYSIVNCLCNIKQTNFIMSGDDSGQVRIWQLNSMKCIQVVKISKWIGHIICTGQKLIFSDSRLNVLEMQKFKSGYSDDNQIIQSFYNDQIQGQFIVTRKSIRFLNIHNGKIEKIYYVCDQEQQISSFIQISSGMLVGTSKGKMKLYNNEGKMKWSINAHDGEITKLKYDRKARFIFSLASDYKLYIWPQKQIQQEGYKKVISFKTKHFNSLIVFDEVRTVILGSSQQNQLVVWDYQNWKLMTVIKLNSPVNIMQFNAFYQLLMISTINDNIYFIKMKWSKSNLIYQIIYRGDSNFNIHPEQTKKRYQNKQQKKGSSKNIKKIIQKPSRPSINNLQQKDEFLITSTNIVGQIEKQNKNSINRTNQKKQSIIKKKTTKSKKKISKDENISIGQQKRKSQESKKQKNNTQTKPQKAVNFDKGQNENEVSQINKKNCSIKFIKISGQKQIDKLGQNIKSNLTLQSIKKLDSDSEATSKMLLKETQFGTFLIMANIKGYLRCFNVNDLIKEHYSQKDKPQIKRQSPSMYRNSKSQYQYEFQKNKHQKLHISKIKNSTHEFKDCFKQVWNFAFTNKQSITGINFIDMNNVYICAGTSDGYYKIFNLCEGKLYGTIKMNLPLPILWDIKIQKDLFIKKNVYQTLMILDRILTNKGFSMVSKQYKSVNITEFLEMISLLNQEQNAQQHIKKYQKQIHLLHEQYTIEDLKGIKPKQNTIKQLQAYKRVKLIKEKMSEGNQRQEEKQQYRNINERQATEFINKKQQVQKLLSPNYFPSLKDQGNSNKFKTNLQVASIESRSQILMDKIKMKKNFTPQYMNLNNGQRNGSIDKQNIFELPSLNSTIKNKQISKTILQKIDKPLNQNKQNVFSMVLSIPSLFKNLTGNNSLTNLTSNMTSQSNIIKKQKNNFKSTLPSKRHTLDDKPIKQILNQIDQKLNMYKKLSYGKRRII